MKYIGLVFFVLTTASAAYSQSSGIKTYCNPVDINYKYQSLQIEQNISYRSGADPVIINHKNEYYLFVTNSAGWWHSKDLLHWNFVTPSQWPQDEDMNAPAARSVRDTLYLFQSTFKPRPIYATTSPKSGRLEFFNRLMPPLPGALGPNDPPGPNDPDIFHDENTDRWYLYWGSSNKYPIYGIELDYNKQLAYVGKLKELLYLHPDQHGWERFGQDHRGTIEPYIEGAWMTKYQGRYYLQYGAPGTEYNVYANGTYVGDKPLGPFTYAPYNPISYKPGGFMAGAGHGNTFQDRFGNYWNTGTPWVAVNWRFERRIAMFPAGFDREGQMFANTRFGDFPHYLPNNKWTNKDALFTGWMLLSYRKPSIASSVQSGGSPLFHVGDFKDPTGLAMKLRDAQNPVSLYLRGQFTPQTLRQLKSYDSSSPPPDPLQHALVEELNEVLKGPGLFDERRFAEVGLTEETRRLIEQKPQSEDLIRLNRLLLEEAYPREIAKSHTFSAINVTDENPRTFWVSQSNKASEWLTVDLKGQYEVKAVQVNYTDYKSNIFKSDATVYTQFRMYSSIDGKKWDLISDLTREKRDRPNAYIELPKPVGARYIKYEHGYVASANLAISDIRIFGNGKGLPPPTPNNLSARRDTDPRNAFIAWERVPGAVGYNILWGIGKNKLYQTYQVFADQGNTLVLRALTIGQDYYFAIEAFDENGVSKLSDVVYIK